MAHLLTLAISATAAETAARAVADLATRATPPWTWNKKIAAAYRAETRAADEAARRWADVRRELVGAAP